MVDGPTDVQRASVTRTSYRDRWLVIASMFATGAIIFWLHSIRVEVPTYDSVRIFLSLLLFQDYPAALVMLALLPLGLLSWPRERGLRMARFCGQHPWILVAITVCALTLGTQIVYNAHPLAMDEYAAVFQAEVFAERRLHGHFPPDLVDLLIPPGFQGHFLGVSHQTGNVASMYWPGFSLLLAPFAWLGITWLANPILGGLAVLLVHRVTLHLTSSVDAAGLAALLTISSPAVSINAVSYYSMTAHLVCNLAFVSLLLRPSFNRAVAAGIVGSIALVLHNPVPHVLVAIPWLLWLFGQRNPLRLLTGAAIGYAPICIFLGFGWWQFLANLTAAGLPSGGAADGSDWISTWVARIGAIDVFRVPGLNTLEDRLMALAKMWIWAVPGLMPFSLIGIHRSGSDVRIRLLAWSGAATLVGYLFVPVDQGHGWGFRYFHAAWFTLPILAVTAVWPVSNHKADLLAGERELAGLLAAWALLSLSAMTGVHSFQVNRFITGHLAQLPSFSAGSAELITVRAGQGYYAADLVQNDPFLRVRPVMIWSQGDSDHARLLTGHFPGLTRLEETAVATAWGKPEF